MENDHRTLGIIYRRLSYDTRDMQRIIEGVWVLYLYNGFISRLEMSKYDIFFGIITFFSRILSLSF